MLDHLFEPCKLDQLTLDLLKTHGTAMKQRLEKEHGGAAEFLPGGRHHKLTPEKKMLLSSVRATSDCIESLFGVLDGIIKSHSKNLSFHCASALATWQYNKTGEWINSLTPKQQDVLICLCRKNGQRLKRESDKRQKDADVHQLKQMETKASKHESKMVDKIHKLFDLEKEVAFNSPSQFDSFLQDADGCQARIRRQIRLQLQLLERVHGVSRYKHLPRLTCAGKDVPTPIVLEQYRQGKCGYIGCVCGCIGCVCGVCMGVYGVCMDVCEVCVVYGVHVGCIWGVYGCIWSVYGCMVCVWVYLECVWVYMVCV